MNVPAGDESPGDPIHRLRSVLQDRYRIEGRLGAGGMATVYLATTNETSIPLNRQKMDRWLRMGSQVRGAMSRRILAWLALAVSVFLAACGDSGTTTAPEREVGSLELVSGGGQKGLAEEVLPLAIRIRVVDRSGMGMAGVRVRFTVLDGGGIVLMSTDLTDDEGVAVTLWRLGPAAVAHQRLEAHLDELADGPMIVVDATAVPPTEGDLVVVHGALGLLKGLVLMRESIYGLEIVLDRITSDTMILLQPQENPGVDLVLFAPFNRPHRQPMDWTPGPDTAHVTLLPPVPVDLVFTVRAGMFEDQKTVIADQLANTESVWRTQGLGIVLGEVRVIDSIEAGVETHVSSSGLCSGLAPGSAIEVTYVTSIDGGLYDGWGCWSGHVFMSLRSRNYPFLLAHELGHTFTLPHTADGLMFPSNPGDFVRDGEIFRAHFHTLSTLNTIFEAQPQATRRACITLEASSLCLPEDYRLGQGWTGFEPPVSLPLAESTSPGRFLDAVQEENPGFRWGGEGRVPHG